MCSSDLARRRRVQLSSEIAPDLPALRADPILIGQVLLNLIRNSAEAIDTALSRRLKESVNALIEKPL